jgi:hypothetical protein
MDYRQITEKYYSAWLGTEENLSGIQGVKFIYSYERNIVQYGYPGQFDLIVWYNPGNIIVSYSEKASDKIKKLKNAVKADIKPEPLKQILTETFSCEVTHNIKFIFSELPDIKGDVKVLTHNDYLYYHEFFKKNNPCCANTDWLQEYFDEMTESKTCCGVFDSGILVSCTDAPGMPYMQDKVQEIGINTLINYRGKGYAAAACVVCAKNIIDSGKCPQWSTAINNIASQRLAYKTGFVKFADIFTVMI